MSKDTDLLKTRFYDYHLQNGGKMVPFAGYSMPVHYSMGIIDEHLHTRTHAGLFDVSHMGQLVVTGDNTERDLEKVLPIDLNSLEVNSQAYSFLPTDEGTILDDLIITRWSQKTFFIVVNGACKEQDIQHFREHLPDTDIEFLDGWGLLALQGPKAKDVMASVAPETLGLRFMQGCSVMIGDIDCYITRSGYTGEDGFEISVNPRHCQSLVEQILAMNEVQWIGLGARDSLRMEAGLCLYGHDIHLQTSPVEAGIAWSISQSRRLGGCKEGGFLGAEIILAQIDSGVERKRVGFTVDGPAPVREGAEIVDQSGNIVGVTTSGGFAPSLQQPVGMAYVSSELASAGTKLNALVRGKPRAITVSTMPLVPHRYHRG
jgi:aminomethyltransferase